MYASIFGFAIVSFTLFASLILWTIKRLIPSLTRTVPCTLPFTFYQQCHHARDKLLRELRTLHGASFRARAHNGAQRALRRLSGAGQEWVTSDPAVVAEVFGRAQLDNFAVRTDQTAAPGTGHLFNTSGERWHQLRRKVMPIFAKHNVDSMASLLHHAVDQMFEYVEEGRPFDFRNCSVMLNACVISRIVYFTAFPDRELGSFPREYARFGTRLFMAKEQALQQCHGTTPSLLQSLQARLPTRRGSVDAVLNALQARLPTRRGSVDAVLNALQARLPTRRGSVDAVLSALQARRGSVDAVLNALQSRLLTRRGSVDAVFGALHARRGSVDAVLQAFQRRGSVDAALTRQTEQPQTPDSEANLVRTLHAHIVQTEGARAAEDAHAEEEANETFERAEARLGQIVMEGNMTAAGIETVGHILATVIGLLADHAELQAQLRAQLEHEEEPALLRAFIREVLRLYPISSFASARTCTGATRLKSWCGAQFSAGDTVLVNVQAMGRDKAVWGPDADQFRPERWLEEDSKRAPEWKSHWLPFGTGARSCPGQQLALHLLRIAIGHTVRRYRIQRAPKITNTELAGDPVCVQFLEAST